MTNRDTDARHRSDARAREIGCSTAIAALVLGGLIAFVVWGAM